MNIISDKSTENNSKVVLITFFGTLALSENSCETVNFLRRVIQGRYFSKGIDRNLIFPF